MKNVHSIIDDNENVDAVKKKETLFDAKQRLKKLEEENQRLKQMRDTLESDCDLMTKLLTDELDNNG